MFESRRSGAHGQGIRQDSSGPADVRSFKTIPNAHGTHLASMEASTLDVNRMLYQSVGSRVQNSVHAGLSYQIPRAKRVPQSHKRNPRSSRPGKLCPLLNRQSIRPSTDVSGVLFLGWSSTETGDARTHTVLPADKSGVCPMVTGGWVDRLVGSSPRATDRMAKDLLHRTGCNRIRL